MPANSSLLHGYKRVMGFENFLTILASVITRLDTFSFPVRLFCLYFLSKCRFLFIFLTSWNVCFLPVLHQLHGNAVKLIKILKGQIVFAVSSLWLYILHKPTKWWLGFFI